ncbi:MAG TPA: hypothetical protein VF384_07570 [Planctomycetota bacterium]
MRKRQSDVDRITTLLNACLGRVDEQARRVQQLDGQVTDPAASHLFDKACTELHGLMNSLLESAAADRADLNRVVHDTVRSFLGETRTPVVVWERLAPDLPPIDSGSDKLASAVRRALVIAASHMETGCQILVATRADSHSVLLDVEGHGTGCDDNVLERSLTLCDFVAGLRGQCRIGSDEHGSLMIELELPRALPIEGC